MWLLEAPSDNARLKDFRADKPSYAILSHTWDSNGAEVTFEDLKNSLSYEDAGPKKASYDKLMFCMGRARYNGLHYAWVDTCCIDKTNQAELTESIASMFRWYQDAARCYVYLSDVSFDQDGNDCNQHIWEPSFRKSRWFRRGWTLQELLAPKSVEFFSTQGRRLGDKLSLESQIHEITRIPIQALRGNPLGQFSIEERMRWAEGRKTTRQEDQAYCLQGIFGVYLSPIYGEGDYAIVRLRKEIKGYQECKPPSQREVLSYKSTKAHLDETEESARKRRKTGSHVQDSESHDLDCDLNTDQNCHHLTKKDLIESLRFDKINDRFDNIKPSLTRTCKWLLQSTQYVDWLNPDKLQEHHGFLWIRGKPGCGKSTLTKFAFLELRKSLRSTKIVSFFFNARGTDLEKSTTGLYRSLLVQLLESCPYDQTWSLPSLTRPSVDQLGEKCETLKQIFSHTLQILRKQDITIVIDALDECDEDEACDMVRFFEKTSTEAVSDQRLFRVLLSSRHYPQIRVKRCVDMVLEDELGHTQDIERYLKSEFRVPGQLGQEIRVEIQKRASGIFMWIVLVVQILNKSSARGQVHTLRNKLEELPEDLNELFRDILTRDNEDLDIMKLCMQWILYAQRPMTPEELYYAILSGLDLSGGEPEESFYWNLDIVSKETMDQFIVTHSKGLAETTKSKTRNVQFIHESVRDFLVKKKRNQSARARFNGQYH